MGKIVRANNTRIDTHRGISADGASNLVSKDARWNQTQSDNVLSPPPVYRRKSMAYDQGFLTVNTSESSHWDNLPTVEGHGSSNLISSLRLRKNI